MKKLIYWDYCGYANLGIVFLFFTMWPDSQAALDIRCIPRLYSEQANWIHRGSHPRTFWQCVVWSLAFYIPNSVLVCWLLKTITGNNLVFKFCLAFLRFFQFLSINTLKTLGLCMRKKCYRCSICVAFWPVCIAKWDVILDKLFPARP